MLSTRIAERRVEDRFIDPTTAERELYGAVEDYIATTYNQAVAAERAMYPTTRRPTKSSMPKRSRTLNTKRSTPGNGLTSRVCSTASGLVRRTASSKL